MPNKKLKQPMLVFLRVKLVLGSSSRKWLMLYLPHFLSSSVSIREEKKGIVMYLKMLFFFLPFLCVND